MKFDDLDERVRVFTGEQAVARRRRIRHDLDLPVKDDYSAFLRNLIARK
jgi:hypothetical protein